MSGPLKRTLLEALLVTVLGLVFAFGANRLSPRGLSLTRNYFPATTTPPVNVSGTNANTIVTPSPTNQAATSIQAVLDRLRSKGLQPIDVAEAKQLFEDPKYSQELTVFIDARDDRHYQEGHIPGAYQFDRYYPERYLAEVLPACLSAMKIVVYCTGGNCEDSEFAASALRDAGIPAERLVVYAGGINDWKTNGFPVELGARKSGNLRQ